MTFRFRFEREGRRGLVELDDVARVQIGPVLSDMDQSEADAHLVLPIRFHFPGRSNREHRQM